MEKISDKELLALLKKQFNYKKIDIIHFLSISSSTYDKLMSPNVEQKLPKKSKHFLMGVLGFKEINELNDKDKLIESLEKNKDKLEKLYKWKEFILSKDQDFFHKRVDLLINLLSLKIFNETSDEKLEELNDFITGENFENLIARSIKIHEFYSSGETEDFDENDILFLGYVVLQNSKNKEKYNELKNKLLKIGESAEERVKNYFESDEFFLFNKKGKND